MRINKDKLSSMAEMNDDALWKEIKAIGAAYGIKLPDKTPPKAELERVRSAMCGPKLKLNDAIGIINNYRRGDNNGKRS